jgi:addiction module HigA family antidote
MTMPKMSRLSTTIKEIIKGARKMSHTHYTVVHPGEVLKDELEETGVSQSALAKHIGVLPKTINEICRGKRGISAEMAMKLSKAFGGSPQFWMNLQVNWEISQIDDTAFAKIKHIAA